MAAPSLSTISPGNGKVGDEFDLTGSDFSENVTLSLTPTSYFRLDNNLTDQEGNHTMSLYGEAAFTESGKLGDGVTLSQADDDHIFTDLLWSSMRGASGNGSFSFSFWFKVDDLTQEPALWHNGKQNISSGGVMIWINSSGNINWSENNQSLRTSSGTVGQGVWAHLAGSFRHGISSGSNMWINGVLDSNFTNFTNTSWPTGDLNNTLHFGAQFDTTSNIIGEMPGDLDEIYFWNKSGTTTSDIITATDVANLFAQPALANPTVNFGTTTTTGTFYSNNRIKTISVPEATEGSHDVNVQNTQGTSSSLQYVIDVTVGVNPQIMLTWSNDEGHTWSNEHWRDIGKIGKYETRVVWRRLGISRDRVYEIRITDPVKIAIIGATIEIEELRS